MLENPKRLYGLIPFSADGMVLAIPLTQAAVGPFAAFNAVSYTHLTLPTIYSV